MQPQKIDLLLHCRWLIPVIPENQILDNYSIAVHGGQIVDLIPQPEARQHYSAVREIELGQHVVMPGLINTHSQVAMRLLRGHSETSSLADWLEKYAQPAEHKFIDSDVIYNSSQLAMAEMIKTGTTCFADMYFPDQVLIDAVREVGLRSQISFMVLDSPTYYARNADEYIHRGLHLYDSIGSHPLSKVACAPLNLNSISDSVMQRLSIFADELDLPLHIPCHKTHGEIEQSQAMYGCRPINRLKHMGLLLPQTQLVHMNQINSDDMQLLELSNSQIVHCPVSSIKAAGKLCPIDQLIQADINVSLGTEGAAVNNSFDLFEELKVCALMASSKASEAHNFDTHRALRLATINGARTLGWEQEIGSIEIGKYADIIALEIDPIVQQPLYNSHLQLVQSTKSSQVSHNWVAGQALMLDRKLVSLNEQKLAQVANAWHEKMLNS